MHVVWLGAEHLVPKLVPVSAAKEAELDPLPPASRGVANQRQWRTDEYRLEDRRVADDVQEWVGSHCGAVLSELVGVSRSCVRTARPFKAC